MGQILDVEPVVMPDDAESVAVTLGTKGFACSMKRWGKFVYFSCDTNALSAGDNELFTITNSADRPLYKLIGSGYFPATGSDYNKWNIFHIDPSTGKCIMNIQSGTTYGVTISGVFMTA